MSVTEHEASPEEKLHVLAAAARNALRALDSMSPTELAAYFDEVTGPRPAFWVRIMLEMHDELRPALNVLGLDYHQESNEILR